MVGKSQTVCKDLESEEQGDRLAVMLDSDKLGHHYLMLVLSFHCLVL